MEMIVVITAMTAISVTGALLVALLMSAETQGARAIVNQQTLSRLGRQLRADAHAAVSARIDVSPERPDGSLVLAHPDGSEIHWAADKSGVLRELTGADASTQREMYQLSDGTTRFQLDESAGLIELVYAAPAEPLTDTYSAKAPPGVLRVWRIQAAMGLDRGAPTEGTAN
jgi:hypothetical protein